MHFGFIIGIIYSSYIILVSALNNGLGKTPAMGWNSWNLYACNINETIVKNIADAIVDNGLNELGYQYVTIDDCWQKERDSAGRIMPDMTKFPSGIKHLADYIHSKGLKFGIYSSAGTMTCMGRPGSLDFEHIDAFTYANWGVDFLKYDNCWNRFEISQKYNIKRYSAMGDALNATGRPIYYAMCNWGQAQTWNWAQPIANSWRSTGDIGDIFTGWSYHCPCTSNQCWLVDYIDSGINSCSITNIIDKQVGITQFSKPGSFNDLDMLEVGNGGMTDTEYKTHFSFWAALKSPLILGNNVADMTASTREIIKNKEIIEINQDPLGISVSLKERITQFSYMGFSRVVVADVWAGPLSNGDAVALLFNRDSKSRNISFSFTKHLGISRNEKIYARNLWKHEYVTIMQDEIIENVHSHGVTVFRFYGVFMKDNIKKYIDTHDDL